MIEFDLKFVPLNENDEQPPVENTDAPKEEGENTQPEEKKEEKSQVSIEDIKKATDALNANDFDNELIQTVAAEVLGDDGDDEKTKRAKVILPTSSPEAIEKNADNFINKAMELGINPDEDKGGGGAEESKTEVDSTSKTGEASKQLETESYGPSTIEELLNEADFEPAPKDNEKSLKQKFLLTLIDKIMGTNKTAQENSKLKKFTTRVKNAKKAKAERDQSTKKANTEKGNKFKGQANITTLRKDYKQAGKDFIAHTVTMTYQLLSKADKDADVKELAQRLGKEEGNGTEKYLSEINDINQRKHVDSGACALALAIKYKEANPDKKSPYAARSTKEALQLASKYKKAFPKYYDKAHNIFDDEYKAGMAEAQEAFKKGETLTDPITGQEVNREIMTPLWKIGSKINQFFMSDQLDVVSLGPKLIFGLYNALTSQTAKNIYKGLFKFGRAIAQRVRSNKEKSENNEKAAELFNVETDTLKTEFDDIVSQHSETQDEVDKSEESNENNEEQQQKPENGEKPEEPQQKPDEQPQEKKEEK